jgi:DnaJ-domain-containing protein 1
MKAPEGDIQDRLLFQLYRILCDNPAGIKEYDLYSQLKEAGITPFHDSDLADELTLYRIHFLLFHLLYTLRDHLRADGQDLKIHCLNIQLQSWEPQNSQVPEVIDPLRSYYMETKRLETVQRQEVEQMITDFWQQFNGLEGRNDALAELGLVEPVSRAEIKKQFRKQAKQHHPDRGGDPEQFRRISNAAETLLA